MLPALLLIAFAVVASAAPFASVVPTCRSENGSSVDFWLAIKMPEGFHYLYLDVTSTTFKKSIHAMDDPTVGTLSNTMNQIWEGLEYIAFNDSPAVVGDDGAEPELDPNAQTAHSKGLIAFDPIQGKGFWLTHSVPKSFLMPSQVDEYQGISDNAFTYGQHLYCKSLTMAQINTLAKQLATNGPDIYASSVSTQTKNNYAGVRDLVDEVFPTTSECTNAEISTVRVFAKTPAWGKDLWDDCISPHYSVGLYVETWLRGLEIGPSCPPKFPFETLDVTDVKFLSYTWTETKDHCKWAVSTSSSVPVVCFGDINRMTSQFKRGGGATCINNEKIWKQFYSAVVSSDSC